MDQNTCGCCSEEKTITPLKIINLPGLRSLGFRIGTHGSFKAQMKNDLSRQKVLLELTSRDDDDPSIALIDAWACVLDVLTFYQERIANEGYLPTATERLSVLNLARAIGYELKPGVAASTFLAFTLDEAQGSPREARIDKGTKVMSIPRQDEKPQTFETNETIDAYASWNTLKPELSQPYFPVFQSKEVYLKGINTGLKSGDGLLIIGKERMASPKNENWDFRRVKTVTTDTDGDYTKVTWEKGLGWKRLDRKVMPAKEGLKIYALRQRVSLFGYNAPDWRAMPDTIKNEFLEKNDDPVILDTKYVFCWDKISATDNDILIEYLARKYNVDWVRTEKIEIIKENMTLRVTGEKKAIYIKLNNEKTKAKLILDDGKIHKFIAKTENGELNIYDPIDWPCLKLSCLNPDKSVNLDAIYSQITHGSWIVLSRPSYDEVYEVTDVEEASCTNFTLSSKVTRVKLSGENLIEEFDDTIRETVVFAKSEELEIAWQPLTDPVSKDTIALDRLHTGLKKEKTLLFSGKRIHAKILIVGMKLISLDDPIKFQELNVGDSLYVLDPPSCDKNGGLEWHLMDRKGFKGSVTETSEKIILLKGSKKVMIKTDGLILVSDDSSKFVYLEKNSELDVLDDPPIVYTKGQIVWHLKYNGTSKPINGHVSVSSERIVFSPAEKNDPIISEAASIKSVYDDNSSTILILKEPLENVYDRKTVSIFANVAHATHGETKTEVLGSGDGSQVFQKFMLKQMPLTYISSAKAEGAESTLQVRVNDILRGEEKTFFGLDGKNGAYIIRLDDDGTVTVQFGDGKTGARLPTGSENINATYRIGAGMQGMVKAGQLSLLMTRPLGVQGVTNPLAPTGADEPEKLDSARQNAPMKVLTLERVVSLSDFQDFPCAFSGIGKASAVWLWGGEMRYVHITIASADGKCVEKTSDLYKNLYKAINELKDPVVQFRIDTFTPLTFEISARILVNEKYIKDKVFEAIKDALRNAFSFSNRNFGEPIRESEIISVIQAVDGVVAVDLDEETVKKIPDASSAHLENGNLELAELLLINPDGIILSEMKI